VSDPLYKVSFRISFLLEKKGVERVLHDRVKRIEGRGGEGLLRSFLQEEEGT